MTGRRRPQPSAEEPQYTTDQAVDPATPPEALEAMARARPDLRALVLLNPATPGGARAWIERGSPPDPSTPSTPSAAAVTGSRTAVPPRGHPRARALLRRSGLWAAVGALLLVAAVAAGAVLGWTAQAHLQARRQVAEPRVLTVQVPAYGDTSGAVMPDVRGLDRDTALQVLADAGVPAAAVTLTDRQAAGPAGAVVEQHPAFGTASPTGVALVTADPALVPDFTGRSASDLAIQLGALGAQVTRVTQYVPGAAAGTAVGIDPAPGQPLPAQVTLRAAEAPGSVFLSTLDAADGGCASGTEVVDGTTYDHALSCSVSQQPAESLWVLSRKVDAVQGVVGVGDDARPGTVVRVEVLADGVSKAAVTVALGKPATLDVPVSGALQLTVRTTRVDNPTDYSSATAVLGDVRLVGGSQQVATLGKQP